MNKPTFFAIAMLISMICSTVRAETQCDDAIYTYLTTLGEGLSPVTEQSVSGSATWQYNSQYGATIGSPNNEDWLLTPAIDGSELGEIYVLFDHTYKFGDSPETEMTMWVTPDFTGDVTTSTWTQITIPQYSGNWKYCAVTCKVPSEQIGANTVIGFKYLSGGSSYPTWEIKNLNIKTYCNNTETFTVTFVDWDGTILKQEEVRKGGYTYPPMTNPSRPGYEFIGWDSSENGYVTRDLTITALYRRAGLVNAPVEVPYVGEARLLVYAQNLQNYYYNYSTSNRPSYSTPEGFADKTHKIVNAALMVNADIYAFCEVEAQEIVLRQLADSMNAIAGPYTFAYISDGISEPNSSGNNVKSGFIYRASAVRPINSNLPASSQSYYCNTMRIQAFQEIETGEWFTLSMNHFKAKDSTSDEGNGKRERNATDLISALKSKAADPDILIMGDLNCEVGESPLVKLENAGYQEQLLRFDANAYSHCYGGEQLIDHVYANASMASQISGAGVFHISTSCGSDSYYNYNYRYSDHDPYIVGISLKNTTPVENIEIQERQSRKVMHEGHVYILLPDGSIFDSTGRRIE